MHVRATEPKVDWVQIGECRLVLADCREALSDIADGAIDLIVTDPPYGHSNNDGKDLIGRIGLFRGTEYVNGSTSAGRPIANDGVEANEVFREFLPHAKRLLKPGCCCCCCGGGGPDPQFARWSLWLDEAIGFKQMVVWDKGPMGMGWHYRRSYETVLVAEKPGAACHWFDDTDSIENVIRPGYRGIRKIIPSKDDHPTPKPVALAAHFIGLHSREYETVLDPFMGRAWVGEACVNMGRKFIGIEIDAEHFDHACKRMEMATRDAKCNLFKDETPPPVQRSLIQ